MNKIVRMFSNSNKKIKKLKKYEIKKDKINFI